MQSTSAAVPALIAGTQPQLSFDIINQPTGQSAAQNVIYITADATFNQITLQIMLTSGSVTLLPGTITTPPTLPKVGTVLYLDLSGLELSTSVWNALELSADDWTFEKFSNSVVGMTPTKNITLSSGTTGALSISISNLEIPTALSTPSATLYVTYYGVPDVTGMYSSFQVAIVNSPANQAELADDLAITVSTNAIVNSSNMPIDTPNSFILQFAAAADGTTVDAGPQTVFNVSFVYGLPGDNFGYGALTNVTSALNIEVSRDSNAGNWTITENTDQQSPSWTLGPPQGPLLGSGEQATVAFKVAKIVTKYRPGPTVLLVSYTNVPGYNDGTFTIVLEKVAHVYINSLKASPNPAVLDNGQASIELSWNALAPSLTLMPGEIDVSGKSHHQTEISDTTTFTLLAQGQQIQNHASADVKVDILPIINSINSEPQNIYLTDFPHNVLLDWNVDTTGSVILSNSVNSNTETYPAATTTGESVAGPLMFTLTPQDDLDLLISRNEVISAFELASNSVAVPQTTQAVAVAPMANLYAIAGGGGDSVTIMESITNQQYGTTVTVGQNPVCLMFSHNGEYLFVGNEGDQTLSVIGVTFNSTSNSYEFNKIKDVSLSGSPSDLDVASDDSFIFVTTNNTGGKLDIVQNGGSNNFFVKATLDIATTADAVAVTPSVGQVFVVSTAAALISVVGYSSISQNFELVGTINGFQANDSPCDVALAGQDSSTLLIACKGSNSVYAVNKDVTSVSGKQKLTVGQSPVHVVVIEEGSYAYVANSADSTVSLISCFSGSGFCKVLEQGLSGGTSPGNLAASPDGAIIYVANNSTTVQVLNAQTYTDGGTKSSVSLPTNVAVSRDWIISWHNFDIDINLPGTQPGPGLSAFNRSTETTNVVNPTTQYINFKFWPDPNLKRAFATISGDNSLFVLETDQFTTVSTISLGSSTTAVPVGMSMSQWGNVIFVLTQDTGGAFALVVIECDMKTDSFKVLSPLSLFTETKSSQQLITSVSDGSLAYVTDSFAKKLYVVSKNSSGSYELESTTFSFILFPQGLVCAPDDSELYIWMNENQQSAFAIFDISSNQLENFVLPGTVTFQVTGMTISPDGSRLFVTDSNFGGIRVFSTVAMQNVENISLAEASLPMSTAIAPDASEVYTANAFAGNFSIAQQLQPSSSSSAGTEIEADTTTTYQGIFLRDYIGETPTSNTGSGWTFSPDIIPQFPNQLPDPTVLGLQANYNTDFSTSVVNQEGKINFIYIRGLNTNTGAQTSRAYFYWIDAATILIPSQWSDFGFQFGTQLQNFLDITAAAQNDIAYSPSPLFWTPQITFPHYCLVVWIDNSSTPSPPDLSQWPTFATWDDVGAFILSHPNVAWRNTNDITVSSQFLNAATQVTGVTGGGQVQVGVMMNNIALGVGNTIQFNLLNSDGSINTIAGPAPIVTNTFSQTINWPANAPTPTLIYTYTPVSGSLAGGEQISVFTTVIPPSNMLKQMLLRHPRMLIKLKNANQETINEMLLGIVKYNYTGS